MRWDPTSAFFQFRGDQLDEPVDSLLDPGAQPEDIARRFLELIGFDFVTVDYEFQRIDNPEVTEIRFSPANLPEIGLGIDLGGSVQVDESGAVTRAQFFWLSLVDIEVVGARDHEGIIDDIENDHGFAPPATDIEEVSITAEDMTIIHVLTRFDESNFILQPAVEISGNYHEDVDSLLPGPARYLVPAVKSDQD